MHYLIALFLSFGVFLIAADRLRIPYLSTSLAMDHLARRQEVQTSKVEIWLKGLAVWLAGKLRLNEYRREQLATDLRAAGIQLSPEMHTANAIVRSALVAAVAIPVYFLLPWLSAVVLALAVLLYLKASRGIADAIREKKKQIEYDLPRFVAHVDQSLKHSRDVLAIIDGYREYAGRAFREELEITAADMRSGSYEAALTRLEARVGSSMLSDVVRCLIGVLHGDNTEILWANLSAKFSEYQRELLKAQAAAIPGKVRKLSMCLLICFMLMYAVVIGMQIYVSIGGLFSL